MSIEGYASATSVVQGGRISFHVSDDAAGMVQIEIFEVGSRSRKSLCAVTVFAGRHATPERAYESGCGWPSVYTLNVPEEWPSGLYRALLRNCESPGAASSILFVVKSANAGSRSKVLLQFASTTYQAYNDWGGKSLYPSGSPHRSRKVSFNRPGNVDYMRETIFLQWMRESQLAVECCTSIDLHESHSFLRNYQLLLSVGHDEYWSREMRDSVEQFINAGGNVAFFSGNVCWWQVRFEDLNRTMVCYRTALEDPLAGTDNGRVTVNWYSAPVNRPENYLTGVSFRNGAGIWQPCRSSMKEKAFRVCHSKHWVFDGTGLCDGDSFGQNENIVGYETDAAEHYIDGKGNVRITGRDGTPPSFVVLALADLRDWGQCGKAGYATMGIYHRTGTVFTAATTDWVSGLFRPKSAVPKITRNVIKRLEQPYPGRQWEVIGDAKGLRAMCAADGNLLAANKTNKLCRREPLTQNLAWDVIGDAVDIVGMTAGSNLNSRHGQEIYAVTCSHALLRCNLADSGTVTAWETIGECFDAAGLALANGFLFAVTRRGDLLAWDLSGGLQWTIIGHIGDVECMTVLDDRLCTATKDGKLWCREALGASPEESTSPWKPIGEGPAGIVSLAAIGGQLFTVTDDGLLWCRNSIT